MERSDEHLLQLALQGDGACFGELAERWQNRIFRFICRYVGSSDEAQDLTQNTFVKAFSNLERLSDPRRFSSWIYTIALNECRMRFRKRGRATVAYEEHVVGDLERSDEPAPDAVLEGKERTRIMHEAFQKLPPEQRAVIVMKEYQSLKFHEIAEILDEPVSTVKSRMYLGLKNLRRLVEKRL